MYLRADAHLWALRDDAALHSSGARVLRSERGSLHESLGVCNTERGRDMTADQTL